MVKTVSFKESEEDIIKHLKDNGYMNSFSYYVKGLIRQDMNNSKISISSKKEEEKPKPRRNANFDM